MANEKRLIDANAMRQDWLENGGNEYVYDTNAVLDSIDAQPTVDAVEVVRCKECRRLRRFGHPYILCEFWKRSIDNLEGFCSYGERRTDD